MKKKQQTFKVVGGSLEIENLSYNPLAHMLIVKARADPKKDRETQHIALYENYYGISEETWYDLLETPEEDIYKFIEEKIKPIHKHIKGGG